MPRLRSELGVERTYTDFHDACADPGTNAVIIATPTGFHSVIASEAARCGKHVFLEKPMAATLSECETLLAASREADVQLQIGFMRRFDESFIRRKRSWTQARWGVS